MTRRLVMCAALSLVLPVAAIAQTDWSKVKIQTSEIGRQIHMITGAGGNIGVFSGPDGVVVIDDQFEPLSDRLLAEIAKISDRPLRFVLNTHWHPDHSGGNEHFSKAGATVIAQDRVTARMSAEYTNPIFGWTAKPSPPAALPVITFNDSISFHMNGETVVCFHVPNAHTDGDVLVWFPDENVMHAGDVFFNGRFPIIDVGTGGSSEGMVAALGRIAAIVNDSTKIINGHSPVGTRADVLAARDMLERARERVRTLHAQKLGLGEILQAKPLADFEDPWGKGYVTSELMVKTIVMELEH